MASAHTEPATEAPDAVKAAVQDAKANRKAEREAGTQVRKDYRKAKGEIPMLSPPVALGSKAHTDVTRSKEADEALAIWKWLYETDKEYPRRLLMYCYRLTPVFTGPRETDKIYGFPEGYEFQDNISNLQNYFLSSRGSGNYKLSVRDAAAGVNLFDWYLNGLLNWEFPPREDIARLDRTLDQNKFWVDEWERRGRIRKAEEGEDNVQQVQTTAGNGGNMNASVINPMVDTIRQLATENRNHEGGAIKAVNDSWKEVVGTMTETMRAANDRDSRGNDPLELTKQFIELSKATTPDIAGILDRQAKVQAESAERVATAESKAAEVQAESSKTILGFVMQELRDARAEMRAMKDAPRENAAPASPLQPLKDLVQAKDLLDQLTGANKAVDAVDAAVTPNSPWWEKFAPAAIAAATPLLNALGGALNLYISRQSMPQQVQQPGIPIAPQPQSQVNPPTQNPQQQNPQPQGDPAVNQFTMLFNAIQMPLLNMLGDIEKDGVDFGLWFISGYGLNTYGQVAGSGRQELILAMKQYAPQLWQAISMDDPQYPGERKPNARFDGFLNEFLDQQTVLAALRGDVESGPESEPDAVNPEVLPAPNGAPAGKKRQSPLL